METEEPATLSSEDEEQFPALPQKPSGQDPQYQCTVLGCHFSGKSSRSLSSHSISHRPKTQSRRRRRSVFSTKKRKAPCDVHLTTSKVTEAIHSIEDTEGNEIPSEALEVPKPPEKPKPKLEFQRDTVGESGKDPSAAQYRCKIPGCSFITANRFSLGGHAASHRWRKSAPKRSSRSRAASRRCCSETSKTQQRELPEIQEPAFSKTIRASFSAALLDKSSSFGIQLRRTYVPSPLFESTVIRGAISRTQSEMASFTERQLTPEDLRVFVLKKTTLRQSLPPSDPVASSSIESHPEEEEISTVVQVPNDVQKTAVATAKRINPVRGCSPNHSGTTPDVTSFVEPSSKKPIVRRRRARTEFRKRTAVREIPDKQPPVVKTGRKRPQTVFDTRPQKRRESSQRKRAETEEDESAVVSFVVEAEENLAGTEERMSQLRVADRIRFRQVRGGTMVGCPYCPYEGNEVAGVMTDHMAFHGADYEFRCEACNYATTTLDTLQFHQFLHDDVGEPLTEELRGFIEDAENGLQGVTIPGKVTLKAPKKWAPLRINSVLYMETAESGKLFGCPMCPMRSPYQSITMEHYVRHFIQIGHFACALCGLKLKTRAALNQHTEAHLKPAAYGIRNDSQKLLVARAEMDRVYFKVGIALEVFEKPALNHMESQQQQRDPSLLSDSAAGELVCGPVERGETETAPDDRIVYKVRLKRLPEIATETSGEVKFQCSVCSCLQISLTGARRKHLPCHGSKRAFTCRFCDFSSAMNVHVVRHERDHEILSQLSIVRLHACVVGERHFQKRKNTEEVSATLPDAKRQGMTALPLLACSTYIEEPAASTSSAATDPVSPRPRRSMSKTPGQKRKSSGGYSLNPVSGNKYVHEWQIPDAITGILTTFQYMCLGCRFESKSSEEMYVEHVPKHINRGEFRCSLSLNRTSCTFQSDSEETLAFHMENHHGPKVR